MAYSLTGKNLNGDFQIVGSLCFPAKASDTVVIHAQAGAAAQNQLLLFYDDQSGSFDAFGAAATTSCSTLVNLARPVCKKTGQDCTPGWTIRPGVAEKFDITINEQVPRQWYFVVANCDPKTGLGSAVNIKSLDISSQHGVECSTLSPQGTPDAAVAIVITFLIMLIILFASTTAIYYKKATERRSEDQQGGGGGGAALLGGSGSTYGSQQNSVSAESAGHNEL